MDTINYPNICETYGTISPDHLQSRLLLLLRQSWYEFMLCN